MRYCAEFYAQRQNRECTPQCGPCQEFQSKREVVEPSMSEDNSEHLRKEFYEQTKIAPVFAEREPYISYIRWLEDRLLQSRP